MGSANRVSLLAVCVPGFPGDTPLVDVKTARSGQEALRLIRGSECDLLLAGDRLPDMSVWTLAARVRAGRPGQRWALVRTTLTVDDSDEIQARSLGALLVFDRVPDGARLHELARSLRHCARDPPPDPPDREREAAEQPRALLTGN